MGKDGCFACDVESMEKSAFFPNPNKYEDWGKQGSLFVAPPLGPDMLGHCVVWTRRHVRTLSELSHSEIVEFVETVDMIIEKLKGLGYGDFTDFTLEGEGRSAWHYHRHIVPKMVIAQRTPEEKKAAMDAERREDMILVLRNLFS